MAGAARSSQKCQFIQFVELSYVLVDGAAAANTRQAKGLRFRVLSFYYVAEERGRSRVQPSFAGGRA